MEKSLFQKGGSKNTTFSIFLNKLCVFSKNFRFFQNFPFFSKSEPKLAQKIEKIEISNPQEFSKKKIQKFEKFLFFEKNSKISEKSNEKRRLLAKGDWQGKIAKTGGLGGPWGSSGGNVHGGPPWWENGGKASERPKFPAKQYFPAAGGRVRHPPNFRKIEFLGAV